MAALMIGVYTTVAYKQEVTYGTPPAAAGAQLLRRREGKFEFDKATFESTEIRSDMQVNDFRHGVRTAKGSLKCDLSPGNVKDFFAAIMGRAFTAGVSTAGLAITIATGSIVNGVQQYTITRGAGSYITDGFKVGDVIRLSVGTFNANNLAKNVQILALTATIATVRVVNNLLTMTAEGPISGSTVSVVGKKTFIPSTAQTNLSFSVEQWASDVLNSEVYSGMKVGKITVNVPSSGMADATVEFSGQGLTTAGAQYFTSPTSAPGFASLAGVNGTMNVNDTPVTVVTGIQFTIERAMTGDAVVGSFVVPQQNPGIFKVSGSFTALFDTGWLRDLFINETETDMYFALTCDNTAGADFLNFVFPRVKLNLATKDDKIQNIVQTINFIALFNNNGGAASTEELTTMSLQDTQA